RSLTAGVPGVNHRGKSARGGRTDRVPASGQEGSVVEEARGSERLGSYLKRLREGYGYTLRRVEERSSAIGEPIDNSQLSRFEKGKAYPSFDKLRVLARIFNVSVQNFSDIIDLQQFEPLKPSPAPFDRLVQAGWEAVDHGRYGEAYVTFEQA